MLTKQEITTLAQKTCYTDEIRAQIEQILRNFIEDDGVPTEKLEAICRLLIK